MGKSSRRRRNVTDSKYGKWPGMHHDVELSKTTVRGEAVATGLGCVR